MINVTIKRLRPEVKLPEYATDGSAALDLRYEGDGEVTIAPGERKILPTGIAIAPESNEVVALLFARSGLASKKGLALANGVGVIDSDYRGEIGAAMINNSSEPITIAPGERIAQLMFTPVLHAKLIEGDPDATERGAGGFGSTGEK